MACSNADDGYATPLAMAVCLAITIGAGGLASVSVSDLKLARRDLARMQAEYALAGAHAEAALRLIESGSGDAVRWSPSEGVEVLAEPEAAKLPEATAVENERLQTILENGDLQRLCARSVISPYGAASVLDLAAPQTPDSSGPLWRAGQVWRMRVAAGGWVDDRVVRFTGSARMPAAVVERKFGRGETLGAQCDAIYEAG